MQTGNAGSMRAARVLVVDDERHIARFLEFVLKKAGYEVATAHDGEQALAEIDRFAPDAVLLDLVMPKLSGLDVLQRLRAEPRHQGLFIAILSARSFEERAGEVMEAGANLHCEKPVAPSSLLSELASSGIPPKIRQMSSEVLHEAV